MVCATRHGTKSGSRRVVAAGCPKNAILWLFFVNEVRRHDLPMICDVNESQSVLLDS
jgi:hypothetical protein